MASANNESDANHSTMSWPERAKQVNACKGTPGKAINEKPLR